MFPSIKARKMFAVLARAPLGYTTLRQVGSHKVLRSSSGYPDLFLAFHDKATVAPGLVRKILVDDVGLTEEEALSLLK